MNAHLGALRVLGLSALLVLAAGCGGDSEPASEAPATEVQAAEQLPEQQVSTAPGGEVIEIRMTMGGGNNPQYEPAQITAQTGDVLRFINVENVHNVHFPQASNPGVANLPPPSPYLTQPGQTYELAVEFAPGTYNFICDPHAAAGMVGVLTVTQ